jgi:hypothetical protein
VTFNCHGRRRDKVLPSWICSVFHFCTFISDRFAFEMEYKCSIFYVLIFKFSYSKREGRLLSISGDSELSVEYAYKFTERSDILLELGECREVR